MSGTRSVALVVTLASTLSTAAALNVYPAASRTPLLVGLRNKVGPGVSTQRATGIKASANAPMTPSVATHWGVIGMMSILANALGRLVPIALEPFKLGGLSTVQWCAYAGTALGMAYIEGYKAFQLKFSPLVVTRAFTLGPEGGRLTPLRGILAPFYSMGLFHATKKRTIVSWSVSLAVLCVVAAVKRLAYPWRSIVDAGVVVGLTWGVVSMGVYYFRALAGKMPGANPELPPQ